MGFIICMLAFKFNPRKIDQVRCCSYHGTINAVGKRQKAWYFVKMTNLIYEMFEGAPNKSW